MLRAAGSLLTILSSALIGLSFAGRLEDSYRELLYLRRLLLSLQGEIRYSRSILSQIFLDLSDKEKEPYASWLKEMGERIGQREYGQFSGIWESGIGKHLIGSGIPEIELERLAELGRQLGEADMEIQMEHLNRYQEQLSVSIRDMREEIRVKQRIYRCLGIAGGIFLVILLV